MSLRRQDWERISSDHRFIRFMEQLTSLFSSEESSSGVIDELRQATDLAMSRAQQAVGMASEKKKYGVFHDTTDQSALAIDTPVAVTFNTTQESDGVSVSGSQISVNRNGIYKIEFRVQL